MAKSDLLMVLHDAGRGRFAAPMVGGHAEDFGHAAKGVIIESWDIEDHLGSRCRFLGVSITRSRSTAAPMQQLSASQYDQCG